MGHARDMGTRMEGPTTSLYLEFVTRIVLGLQIMYRNSAY